MRRFLLFSLALGACAPASCVPRPGLLADDEPIGPSLRLAGEVDGAHALLSVHAKGLGEVFGLSFHLRLDDTLVAVVAPEQLPVLGEGAVLVERVADGDLAFGGTRPSRAAGEVEVADGPIATVELRARVAATSRVQIEDALARRLDGSFATLAAVGGELTLEAP